MVVKLCEYVNCDGLIGIVNWCFFEVWFGDEFVCW